ncbi:MAG: carboxypeptidase regulatory-like domain-containing protein [Pyrinomonadaceae bacterium]
MKKIVFPFILMFVALNVWQAARVAGQTQTDILSPQPGGVRFGTKVATLPNGNFVVTDPNFDAPGASNVGRVYLYNGQTLALINTMTGTTADDMIGLSNVGLGGVMVLANGNYIVISGSWDNGATADAGAVTRCSAVTGCPATITPANSLVGTTAGDFVGGVTAAVTTLSNGNYVVRSPSWDDGAVADVGAVTFCNGVTGCTGPVSAANSLVGSTTNDQVGLTQLRILSNGNYVVPSFLWSNGAAAAAGAVTRCSGTSGCTGPISAANSLVGAEANQFLGGNGDVFPLANGAYVVTCPLWSDGVTMNLGAATFCNSATGCVGTVTAANSLTGTTANDQVGLNGAAALTNGNYVVRSGVWNNGAAAGAGAVTFCSGTAGCVGLTVSPTNSLVGSTTGDNVGSRGVTVLTNGNYVSRANDWRDPMTLQFVGAATWCSGTTGCTGPVTTANSFTGLIGNGAVTPLTNGNYVVSNQGSSVSNSGAGAVSLCNVPTGCVGTFTLANSLVGSTFQDRVGQGITTLTNGNYVVNSPQWNSQGGGPVEIGAATLCSGTTGCVGAVSSANSLVGSTVLDRIGQIGSIPAALSNGNYVVMGSNWDNGAITDAGSITLCNGGSGCIGTVSPANSLVGSTSGDMLGAGAFSGFGGLANGVTPLGSGNYVVKSPSWDNGPITDAGAITYSIGNGATIGPIAANNSVRGTIANGGADLNFSFDAGLNQLVVGRPADNIVTVFRPASPSAASVSVSGRVRTTNGRGIARARVLISDINGVSRSTLTSSFGYYRFENIEVGQTYTIEARAKTYFFNAQIIRLKDTLVDLDIIALP